MFADAAGRDVVRDFRSGEDKLMFVGAEGFADLSIVSQGARTIVSYGEIEAVLRGTSDTDLDQNDFVF